MCCRSGSTTLQQLPAQWLKEVLEEVKCSDPSSKLCATRRSAGIPFYLLVTLIVYCVYKCKSKCNSETFTFLYPELHKVMPLCKSLCGFHLIGWLFERVEYLAIEIWGGGVLGCKCQRVRFRMLERERKGEGE